jgi:multidrug efflux pump subunit AcrA (membrane-fusion protein)
MIFHMKAAAGFNIFIVIITLFFPLFSCGRKTKPDTLSEREQVSTIVVKKEMVIPEFTTFGTVVYYNKADVFPTTEGTIKTLHAEEGMVVEKNQILLKLDQKKLLISREEVEADVTSKEALLKLSEEKCKEGRKTCEASLIAIRNAEAELEQKQKEFENISSTYETKKKLFEVGGVTKEELESIKTTYLSYKTKLIQAEGELEIQKIGFRDEDIIEAGYEVPENAKERFDLLVTINTRMLEAEKRVAEAELNSVRSNLKIINLLIEETLIRAPISGIIGSRYLDIGEKATPETKLFTIFNTDRVYVVFEVSEKDLGLIKENQQAYIKPDNPDTPEVKGHVRLISPYINPETRTCSIKIEAGNSEGNLTPGLFVRVRIVTGEEEKQIVIGEDTVLTDERGLSFVFLVRDSRLFKQEVNLGNNIGNRVVIHSGITEGDRLCTTPSLAFRDGMEVEVQK